MGADSDLIVSVSGVRGVVGTSLTPHVALSFASAFGKHLGGGRVVVSRDGRPSGAMLRHAVLAGLTAAGCEVHDLGVAATPTVGFAVRTLEADGGVQITASHNPAPWNGLKLFGGDGRVLSATAGRVVAERFANGEGRFVPWDQIAAVQEYRRAEDDHRERIQQLVDVPRIRAARLRAFVDGNGGAGGPLARKLLKALGVEAHCHACDADGFFLHEPEPTEANLRGVGPLMATHRADVGFALDPDSDRLAVLDEAGRYVGEELTLALAVWQRLSGAPGPVVVNMSTSRVTADVAAKLGSPCYHSAVGEANVADKMLEVGAVIGGEGNGGVMDPRVGLVRDPFIGIGLILNLMADTGKRLSELVGELPAYRIVKEKYPAQREALPGLFEQLAAKWPEASADRVDGLRLDWDDRWVHVRPSNTEPVVRVIAEAPDPADAEALCRDVGAMLKG
jgi:phosphomannomutase